MSSGRIEKNWLGIVTFGIPSKEESIEHNIHGFRIINKAGCIPEFEKIAQISQNKSKILRTLLDLPTTLQTRDKHVLFSLVKHRLNKKTIVFLTKYLLEGQDKFNRGAACKGCSISFMLGQKLPVKNDINELFDEILERFSWDGTLLNDVEINNRLEDKPQLYSSSIGPTRVFDENSRIVVIEDREEEIKSFKYNPSVFYELHKVKNHQYIYYTTYTGYTKDRGINFLYVGSEEIPDYIEAVPKSNSETPVAEDEVLADTELGSLSLADTVPETDDGEQHLYVPEGPENNHQISSGKKRTVNEVTLSSTLKSKRKTETESEPSLLITNENHPSSNSIATFALSFIMVIGFVISSVIIGNRIGSKLTSGGLDGPEKDDSELLASSSGEINSDEEKNRVISDSSVAIELDSSYVDPKVSATEPDSISLLGIENQPTGKQLWEDYVAEVEGAQEEWKERPLNNAQNDKVEVQNDDTDSDSVENAVGEEFDFPKVIIVSVEDLDSLNITSKIRLNLNAEAGKEFSVVQLNESEYEIGLWVIDDTNVLITAHDEEGNAKEINILANTPLLYQEEHISLGLIKEESLYGVRIHLPGFIPGLSSVTVPGRYKIHIRWSQLSNNQ